MGELVPGLSYREFVEAAMAHRDEASFRSSAFFATWGRKLDSLLETPRVEPIPAAPSAASESSLPRESGGDRAGAAAPSGGRAPANDPRHSKMRIVQWNIEKGKELERIRRRLRKDPMLHDADVYCLNEVDCGTARSASNADIARELAATLRCHSAFVPSYIECTKGPLPDERDAPGENEFGFHGLAILSRHPILDAKVVNLPHCFDYFTFREEKRLGQRQGLFVLLDARPRAVGSPPPRTWRCATRHGAETRSSARS